MKKLSLRGNFYLFAGGNYLSRDGKDLDLTGGIDLSLGAEYQVNKRMAAWLNVNNIFNDKYERWHAYPVYGINLLAGMSVRF